MLDPFDYKEPSCALCGGEEFYYPDKNAPSGHIPLDRVLAKLDGFLNRNEMSGAAEHLEYWRKEAVALNDKRGELEILSEMMGLYRKRNDREKGLEAIERGLELLEELGMTDTIGGATIFLNAATAEKAFGFPEKAVKLYALTERVYERELDPSDVRRAGLYNNRALAYVDVGEVEKAVSEYQKALNVLSMTDKNENEIAITYINMAHLYENIPNKDTADIMSLLDKAYECLNSPNIEHNGYHAFVCEKCAPSFGYFGYFDEERVLRERAKELYARS